MNKFKKAFRKIHKFPDWLYWFPSRIMLLWRHLTPTEIIDPNGLLEEYLQTPSRVCVVTLWHNRLLMLPPAFPKSIRQRTVAVISASRDGQYIADFAAQFGVKSIRGSSRGDAVSVLRNALNTVKGGCLVVFTPDGPRGPRYRMSKGPVHVASKLGAPLIAVGINYSAYWSIRSWDGFRIPKPWSKMKIVIGDELHVPQDLNADQMEEWRLKAQDELDRVSMVTLQERQSITWKN